jgi:hypothetical protein
MIRRRLLGVVPTNGLRAANTLLRHLLRSVFAELDDIKNGVTKIPEGRRTETKESPYADLTAAMKFITPLVGAIAIGVHKDASTIVEEPVVHLLTDFSCHRLDLVGRIKFFWKARVSADYLS